MEEENRSMLWVLVVGVILVIVAIFLLMQNNAANNTTTPATSTTTTTTGTTDETADPVDPNTDEVFEMEFDLNEQNDSAQIGTVTFQGQGDETVVTIALGNPNATSQPAHIHMGRCPTPGAVVYPLTDVVNGSSETTLDVSLDDLIAQGELALNVHKSSEESDVYVSCGDLDFK